MFAGVGGWEGWRGGKVVVGGGGVGGGVRAVIWANCPRYAHHKPEHFGCNGETVSALFLI